MLKDDKNPNWFKELPSKSDLDDFKKIKEYFNLTYNFNPIKASQMELREASQLIIKYTIAKT